MDYNKLTILRKQKRISIEKLDKEIGMTKNGMATGLRNKRLKIGSIEKISQELEVFY